MLKSLISGACVAAFSITAFAQSSPGGSPASQMGVEEIVITAQRRTETAQKAGLSIEAVSAEELARFSVSRPEDLNLVTTGVQIASGANLPQVYIRGIGTYATNSYAENAIATNIDGVYISRPWATRGAYFDLERVEVLKGPQGTLYGRNASGGAINLLTNRPKLGQTGGYVEAEVGAFNSFDDSMYRIAPAVNVAIGQNSALRLSGQFISRDGYLQDGSEDDDSQAVRVHFYTEPNDDFSLLLSAAYTQLGGKGAGRTTNPVLGGDPWLGVVNDEVRDIILANNPTMSPFGPPPGFLLQQPVDDTFLDVDMYSVSAELNWDFGPATLTFIPAYRTEEFSNRFNEATFVLTENEDHEQLTLEARLSGDTDRMQWVVGAYYFDENQTNPSGKSFQIVEQGLIAPPDDIYDFRFDTTSYAVFGQTTFSLSDPLRLTLGLRYTDEEKSQNFESTGSGSVAGDISFDSWTYKVGLEYDLAPQSLLYASVSTGFKSGGLYGAPPPNSYQPEDVLAFDLGVKNRFLDNRLQLNVEAFYIDYKDQQQSHLGLEQGVDGGINAVFVTENAADSTSYGALVDVTFAATDSDIFAVGVQYNNTEYDDFTYTYPSGLVGPAFVGCPTTFNDNGPPGFDPGDTETVDCSGFSMLRAPEWAGRYSYQHIFGFGSGATLTAGIGGQFASKSWLSIDFLPSTQEQGYATLDADLTYVSAGGKWLVALWGRNLTEEAIYNDAFRSPFIAPNSPMNPLAGPDGLVFSSIRPQATYGVRFRFDF